MSIMIRGADGRLYSVSAGRSQVRDEVQAEVRSSSSPAFVSQNADRLSANDFYGTGI